MARVLIVDDDPEVRGLLVGVVERVGHEVLEAPDALHAWAQMPRDPDIILIDIDMPDMPGTDFVVRVHSDQRWLNVPVVFVTSFRERAEPLLATDPAIVEIIDKPFRLDRILHLLDRLLERPRVAAVL